MLAAVTTYVIVLWERDYQFLMYKVYGLGVDQGPGEPILNPEKNKRRQLCRQHWYLSEH